MKDFLNSWPGIIIAVVSSVLIGHYLGFLPWLLFFVACLLFVAFHHSKDTRQL
jgi:hypothetical protein